MRIALLCGALFASAGAQAATQTATTKVVALKPITLVNATPLDFGSIVPGATNGSVTINARTGARTRTVVTLVGATFSRAQFVGTATVARVVTLTVSPAASITITSGANSMVIDNLRVSANGGVATVFGRNYTIPATGSMTYNMGGRLVVGANKPAGTYTGTFSLTLNYQ
jgi:Mat/Ecp fimbriae major subunit